MTVKTDDTGIRIGRRTICFGLPLLLAACAGDRLSNTSALSFTDQSVANYGPLNDEKFPIPAMDTTKIDNEWLRQEVDYKSPYQPGTIVVDPGARHLYLIRENGKAMRYGVGVGREGFGWTGEATIKRKAEWPTWTPPVEMQARDKEARKYAGGMPGGIDNPLGARALYLYQGDRDTMYRLHGNNDPSSIGTAVSSGCIRLFNHDIVDLYRRVPVGTKVVVLPTNGQV
jgi:lipoprotein-anchoring transpeptidase ErfK/SrfK